MARRGHGEGSLYQRADKRWVAQLTLGYDAAGKRRYWRAYGKTRREVAEALRRALDEQHRGHLVTSRQRVDDYLHEWLERSIRPYRAATTHATYRRHLDNYIVPSLGRLRLDELSPQHVQAMLTAMLDRGLAPRTAIYSRAVLRRALNQALAWGLVSRNVAALVDPPPVRRADIRPLTLVEARQLLEHARGHRLEALVTLTLATGLRQGEALGLAWSDVDLDGGTVTPRLQVQEIAGRLELVPLKTEASAATIALPAFVVQAIRAHRSRQLEERLAAGPGWQDHGLVFPSGVGTPQNRHNLLRSFKALLVAAELPAIRFHDLRHTAATLLRGAGTDLKTIQETLRHANLATTADLYTHFVADVQRRAADAMDQMLGGG